MSNKEQLEDIATKKDDEETNLGVKTTSHEGTESIKTRTDSDCKNIGKSTITCGTEIIEPLTNENIHDNTDPKTSLEGIKNLRSEQEILQGIDVLLDVPSTADSGNARLPLNKSECGDIEKDNNIDNTISFCDEPLVSIKTAPQSCTEASNTNKTVSGDNMINSDTEKVDEDTAEKTNEGKAIHEDTCDTEKVNIENSVDDITIDETDKEITKTAEDQGISNDSLDSIDKIDDTGLATTDSATELCLQHSDSNEDMLLRWDDDDEDEHAESNIDNVAESDLVRTIDNDSKSPTHETIVKPVIETEISSTMDICDIEQTIDKEISKDNENTLFKEDENLNNDVTEVTNEDKAITAQNDNINEETILIQSAPVSDMEVDTVISEINNDNIDLNKKTQESSSIMSSQEKSTEDIDIKMDVDLSIVKEKNVTIKAVDENSEISTEIQPQQSPVQDKVDVHNPNTSVKEYSVDLSIVTGEVNGPERNADCHDLLQIKDQSHDSSFDDSLVVNTEHGLKKPDMMLEIPTQELIDFEDSNVDDDDEMPTLDETVDGNANEIEQQVSSTETQEMSNDKQSTNEKCWGTTLKETIQEKGDAVEPKDIENQTKKQSELDKDINSQTKPQVEPHSINKNDNQDTIQAVNTNEKETTKENIQTPEKSDAAELKDIENQTKKQAEQDIDSKTKGQAEQDKINENDIQQSKQAVKPIESSKDDIEDKPLDSEKHSADTVITKALDDVEESIELIAKEIIDQQKVIDAQPSTSTEMVPDTADEVPDVSDSLGLLAESSRPVEDDDDDVFDDEDFYQDDESSNQMTAEHSEDSNAPPSESDALQSESDVPKAQREKETETPPVEKEASKTEADKDVDMESEKIISPEVEKVEESPTDDVKIPEEHTKVEEKTTESVEVETVKLSDTSDNEADTEKDIQKQSVLRQLLLTSKEDEASEYGKQSQSKTKKLEITQQKNFVNIVDLEESSEDDEEKADRQKIAEQAIIDKTRVTSVNIPLSVEVMTLSGSGGNMCEMRHKGDEVIITGLPKPPPHKPTRLNTSEVTIKTASTASTLVIPEKKIPKLGLEIFNIDSDEDSCSGIKDASTASPNSDLTEEVKETPKEKCINLACKSDGSVPFVNANASTVAFFNFKKKKRPIVCEKCADMVATRAQELVEGIRQFTPILDLDAGKEPQELVEISDSESEEESEVVEDVKILIGEKGAKYLEENLADMINETWKKFKMDERLQETQDLLSFELNKLEQQSKEIDDIFNECQIATDKLRNELYATFEGEKQEMPAIIIFDTPYSEFTLPEEQVTKFSLIEAPRQNKRRLSSASEPGTPAKRAAIPLGYTPLDADASNKKKIQAKTPVPADTSLKVEDDREVSVVQLSAEAAPAGLPAPGEVTRAPVKSGMPVYAMRNAFGSWLKGKVLECQPKGTTSNQPFTMCRVKFEHKVKNPCKVLSARCLAYSEPADVRMTIGTRVIALCRDSTNTGKRDSFYAGVVAEIPNPVNNYRYLVFFDDGYAQYVVHSDTRLVCECSHLVWEEVHPFSREFVRDYLLAYPERPMVRLHAGQSLKTEWNGKWWVSRVVVVDASLVQVQFDEDNRVEWIYRGSTRLAPLYLELQAAERTRARPLPRSKTQRSNMPYVEYTRTDEQGGNKTDEMQVQEQQNEEMRRQRAVAKKSTATPSVATPLNIAGNLDTVTSRVVYYTPKNAVRPLKMTTHTCSPKCKRTDTLALKDLRTYNPLAKPLLSGWERQIVRFKGQKEVMYRTPCGRRVRDLSELHRYLRATRSDMPVDLFDFHPNTHCLAEFVLNKCNVGKKDLSHGKENVPVPCVNYYDDSLPEFCSYNTERTPTAGVPLNLDPDFLCGCDCTDDCADKTKCSCWKLTLEGARTIGLDGPNVGYSYKRLPEPLPSGIYECNSRCKCKHTCLNRVAQHPLQLKLQVFKTLNRGWGIRALNDVPKGAFLCVYAGNLLTDATANLDGLNEGDEYLAELDYIEVVEQMKEGFEEDIPDADKKLDKKESKTDDNHSSPEVTSSEEDEEKPDKNDVMDDDFSPGYIGLGLTEFNKRLRKRGKGKKGDKAEDMDNKEKEKEKQKEIQKDGDEDCITISDDEEVRQPSRFTAQAGMGANEFVPKYKSVRAHFGKDEACYIMDAKVQGNIGRYLNHSCSPNVFVQNVFVDTHDPRFPWVAFFALSHIRAGTELTWNYNYDIGSVPEKVLYCFCGAPNCRRRLL